MQTQPSLCTRCVPLATNDATMPDAKRLESAMKYADRAVALLKQSVASGQKDAARLTHDADLAPLRDREDFRELLKNLESGK
jgi:hypothetical protein